MFKDTPDGQTNYICNNPNCDGDLEIVQGGHLHGAVQRGNTCCEKCQTYDGQVLMCGNSACSCHVMLAGNTKSQQLQDDQCPVCGYYCLGKGGIGCIDKPSMQNPRLSAVVSASPKKTEVAYLVLTSFKGQSFTLHAWGNGKQLQYPIFRQWSEASDWLNSQDRKTYGLQIIPCEIVYRNPFEEIEKLKEGEKYGVLRAGQDTSKYNTKGKCGIEGCEGHED